MDQNYWDDLLIKEFSKESDRAAVVLVGGMFDVALAAVLKNYLVPVSSPEDNLFDGPSAPFSNFSSKIDIAHRIGLISSKFARDLHLIRKIRNSFAHDIVGCDFTQPTVAQKVHALSSSSFLGQIRPNLARKFPDGTRGDFLLISSFMLWLINGLPKNKKSILEAPLEAHYREEIIKRTSKDLTEDETTSKNVK